MKNFKEIAEKCLAGELKGTFKNRKGDSIPSGGLFRVSSKKYPYTFYYSRYFTIHGEYINSHELSDYDIINFISDNMQKKIEINIPEGKVPVMESSENGIIITWKEHELTYTELSDKFGNNINWIHSSLVNSASQAFYKKVEVIRKLTNIRNYFGKPENDKGYGIFYHEYYKKYYVDIVHPFNSVHVCFNTKEQAEQAIKILGDDVKYLFEPW